MKAAVVVFPGINRERDMARTLKLVSGTEPSMVWHADTALPAGTDLVVIPGGFSYGDYLRCGAIAARAPIMDAVRAHAGRGGGLEIGPRSDDLDAGIASERTTGPCEVVAIQWREQEDRPGHGGNASARGRPSAMR